MSDLFAQGFIAQGRSDGDSDEVIREAAYLGWTQFGFLSADEYFTILGTLSREGRNET